MNEIYALKIAKASISLMFGVEPKEIKSYFFGKGGIAVEYTNSDSNSEYTYGYKVELRKDKVVWAIDGGRWRDNKLDSTLTYRIIGDKVLISELFTDGTKNMNYFNLKDL